MHSRREVERIQNSQDANDPFRSFSWRELKPWKGRSYEVAQWRRATNPPSASPAACAPDPALSQGETAPAANVREKPPQWQNEPDASCPDAQRGRNSLPTTEPHFVSDLHLLSADL